MTHGRHLLHMCKDLGPSSSQGGVGRVLLSVCTVFVHNMFFQKALELSLVRHISHLKQDFNNTKIEIISSFLSDHNEIKLDINNNGNFKVHIVQSLEKFGGFFFLTFQFANNENHKYCCDKG